MAGSYNNLRDKETGHFQFGEEIENLRDAYEVCKECFFIIDFMTAGDNALVQALLQEYYLALRGGLVAPAIMESVAKLSSQKILA